MRKPLHLKPVVELFQKITSANTEMAAFKRLLSQTGPTPSPPPARHLLSLLRRHFSTENQPNPEPGSDPNRKSIPIQPVSYPTRPKPPPSEEIQQHESPIEAQRQTTTTTIQYSPDEMRYMKDAAVISPVSYPSRVAPLPDDRVGKDEEKVDRRNEGLERERRKIDEYRRRGVLAYGKGDEEEEDNLPFPKLIKGSKNTTEQNKKNKVKVIHDLKEAIKLVKASAKKTFDETLEAHLRMTPEMRKDDAELKVNSFLRLPHTFGKILRVAVFAEGAAADEARDAGADIVGGPELVENILAGQLKVDFDKCIATPSMMQHVKKVAKKLRKLMPNTKKGTLTNDIFRTVKEAKEISVHFANDRTAIVHVGLGKLSFPDDALRDNVGAFVNALLLAKPSGLRKSSKFAGYVEACHICSTMGPSFPVSIQSLSIAADRYNRLQLQRPSQSTLI